MPPRVSPICLYREAMRLQCFPPTRYVKLAQILCLNTRRPFTTQLCKALICSIIDVTHAPFLLVCWFYKIAKKHDSYTEE